MKEKELISKWLDHDLTEEELEAFKALNAFGSLNQLSESAKLFAAPSFNTSEKYSELRSQLTSEEKKQVHPLWKKLAAAAAVVAILFSLYVTFFNGNPDRFIAENGEQIHHILPDASEVDLNAGSIISYSKDNWQDSRSLNLEGEAYFKVAKGSRFDVRTERGIVSVLGTEFNVKERGNFFEVVCYEGLVSVTVNGSTEELPAGKTLRLQDGTLTLGDTKDLLPTWLLGKTNFNSVPVLQALDEIERQFDVTIVTEGFDVSTIYTGTISHENLEDALDAIAIPLGLEKTVVDSIVTLKK